MANDKPIFTALTWDPALKCAAGIRPEETDFRWQQHQRCRTNRKTPAAACLVYYVHACMPRPVLLTSPPRVRKAALRTLSFTSWVRSTSCSTFLAHHPDRYNGQANHRTTTKNENDMDNDLDNDNYQVDYNNNDNDDDHDKGRNNKTITSSIGVCVAKLYLLPSF